MIQVRWLVQVHTTRKQWARIWIQTAWLQTTCECFLDWTLSDLLRRVSVWGIECWTLLRHPCYHPRMWRVFLRVGASKRFLSVQIVLPLVCLTLKYVPYVPYVSDRRKGQTYTLVVKFSLYNCIVKVIIFYYGKCFKNKTNTLNSYALFMATPDGNAMDISPLTFSIHVVHMFQS